VRQFIILIPISPSIHFLFASLATHIGRGHFGLDEKPQCGARVIVIERVRVLPIKRRRIDARHLLVYDWELCGRMRVDPRSSEAC
jgi:hypothetical protein